MIKTDKMNLAKELSEDNLGQPQVRFPPPRYPGDLALIYLKHRFDVNILNYLRMNIDEQFERTYHMFCGRNNGWEVNFCGHEASINLDPPIYFTHMERISREITDFCIQWPYGIPRIIINCQVTEYSILLARLKCVKQLIRSLEWIDEIQHYLPHKKVIYDFSNTFVAFPHRTLQQYYKQMQRFSRMKIRHTIWKQKLEKKQAYRIAELITINQIRVRNEIIENLSKRYKVRNNGIYLVGYESRYDKDIFMKVIRNVPTLLYSNIFIMPTEIQQKIALTFYNACKSYGWDVKVNGYQATVCINAFELWNSPTSEYNLMIYFYLLWPREKPKIIVDCTHNLTFRHQGGIISITQTIIAEYLDYCVPEICHNQVILDFSFLFSSTYCSSNPDAVQTRFERVMNRFLR